jgi:membrane fusion protein (multidrug efflux system)
VGLVFIILLAAAAGVLLLLKTDQESKAIIQAPPRQVRVAVHEIVPKTYTRWFEAYATAAPFRKGTVSAQVTGPILQRAPDTEPGSPVQKNQELARIEDRRYRLSLQKAKASLEKLRALLQIERNENERRTAVFRIAKQRLALAQSDYERKEELFEKELVAKQTLELAESQMELQRSEFERARSELQNRQARIKSIEADIASAKAEVDRIEEDLADTIIRAPFDGIIGERFIEVGDQIAPGQRLYTVLDIDSVKVKAQIPSEHIDQIKAGTRVEVNTKAHPGTIFQGTVIHIYPEADLSNRTFAVEVKVSNSDDLMLFPGMFARVRIPLMRIEQALLVPRDAVLEDTKGIYLYVADPSSRTAKRRDVTIEDVGPEEALVADGLKYGEMIIVGGQELLHDGALIRWDGSPHRESARNTATPNGD